MGLRLGLDMGTNSIGWWIYRLDDQDRICESLAGGVRVFSDGREPRGGASLAVSRRLARSMRRRRDRFLRRRKALINKLIEAGLLPKNPDEVNPFAPREDPYELRTRALDERLELYQIGRVLFHLNQRRGFKSNRKTDKKENVGGKIKEGAARLDQSMQEAGARTYGDFLHGRRESAEDEHATPPVRTRMGTRIVDGKKQEGYDYYPTRKLLEDEFHEICNKQAEYYPDLLTEELTEDLFRIIFFQRPLKAPKVGLCLYNQKERRLAKSHPLFQERRLYEAVNALRIRESGKSDIPISIDQRDLLVLALQDKRQATFAQLRKLLKLQPGQEFNLESKRRTRLEGNEIRAVLGDKTRFGIRRWSSFSTDEQWQIIKKLRDSENRDELLEWLKDKYQLEDEQANDIADAPLPEGYGRIGLTATRKMLEELRADVVVYSDAVARAGYHHSDRRTGVVFEELPYYGELLQSHVIPGSFDETLNDPVKQAPDYWGRITNPTVHIALGQLRHLTNDLIKVFGRPDQIVVELARDLKNSGEKKKEIDKQINKNTLAAIARGKKLEEEFGEAMNTGRNRAIMRIWEGQGDLEKKCPYCGEIIGCASLFNGSTDVDHILPYRRSLDDGISNKVICHQRCNREKRDRTPYEAWGHDEERWALISNNVESLPKSVRWRFAPDAMERFEADGGFLKRQLTDTQYIARITREYLSFLYPEKGEGSSHVWVVPGRLTEMLRRSWGVNGILSDSEHHDVRKKKNRQDHRHHAIDAAVIAATDRGLLNSMARASGKSDEQAEVKAAKVEPPYEDFRNDLIRVVSKIMVSHRVDHGTVKADDPGQTAAQLHNETAYGLTGDKVKSGADIVVYRKPLESLGPKDIQKIRDPELLADLYSKTRDLSGKEFTAALVEFSRNSKTYRNIRRVRLIDNLSVIPIKDKMGRSYKGYKGDSNHCVEVWELPDGKWKSMLLTTFDAHKYGLGSSRPHPAARLKMRLFRGDVVTLENHPRVLGSPFVIAKMSDVLSLFPPEQANVDARVRSKSDPFKYVFIGLNTFQKYKLRKVGVDRIGRVRGLEPDGNDGEK